MKSNTTALNENRQNVAEKRTPELTVIIPTLADTKRKDSLLRAIDSIIKQTNCLTTVIVVVNGQRFEHSLLNDLVARKEIEVVQVSEPSVKIARHRGLLNVKTPYFSFLDDDDELLEDANSTRLETLKANPDCAFVASGGYRIENGIKKSSASNLGKAIESPYEELCKNNWLTSCGCIFRSSMISPDIFDDLPDYHEWTYLAYRLLICGKFCIIKNPCYIIHESPSSLSKTLEYSVAHAEVFRRILTLNLPAIARNSVRRRLAMAEHDAATVALKSGYRVTALKHHLRSLLLPGGIRYLSFTRHLLT